MTAPDASPLAPISPESVRAALRQVIDPEAGMNIVDLGLIYSIELGSSADSDSDADADCVRIEMTMTSPTCPMGDMIMEEVQQAVAGCLPAGWRQDVRLVWEPPWGPERMSDKARAHFGWEG